jgi:hypothetical protein
VVRFISELFETLRICLLFVVLFLAVWNGPMTVPPVPKEFATEGKEPGPGTAKKGGKEPKLRQVNTQEKNKGTAKQDQKTGGVNIRIREPRGGYPRTRTEKRQSPGRTKRIGHASENIQNAQAMVDAGEHGPGGIQ